MDDNKGIEAKASSISKWGIGLSLAYLFGLTCYAIVEWHHLLEMRPNELGDFLAGAFGPLALGWLVCGYFQQGIELRQNTQALSLQVEELKNSVEQQAALAKANQDLLEHEREVAADAKEAANRADAPRFDVSTWGANNLMAHSDVYVKVLNGSGMVFYVEKDGGPRDTYIEKAESVPTDGTFTVRFPRVSNAPGSVVAKHIFRSRSGRKFRLTVTVGVDAKGDLLPPLLSTDELT